MYSELWEYNYRSRTPKYTLSNQLLPKDTPVAQLVCLHDIRIVPLKVPPGIFMNWETGLIHHKECGKPISDSVAVCWGCEENFWGGLHTRYCVECAPYA